MASKMLMNDLENLKQKYRNKMNYFDKKITTIMTRIKIKNFGGNMNIVQKLITKSRLLSQHTKGFLNNGNKIRENFQNKYNLFNGFYPKRNKYYCSEQKSKNKC